MRADEQRIVAEPEGILFAKPESALSPVRVLAVDDEAPALKFLCLILGAYPFECTTVNNGEEALVAIQRQQFDAVISDLRMPGISGMELLSEARRRNPHVAFVVTTGVDDAETGVKAMRAGADDYLVKPLLDCVVLASLERSLQKHRLEEQLEAYRLHLEETVEERTRQLQTALRQIELGYEQTLQALGAAIDLRDSTTAGHSQRVSRYSLEIAKAIGLPDAQIVSIMRGACLHDIGKLGIPDRILLKPGPLSGGERRLMQRHVRIGFGIIKGIPFLLEASEIILNHHERFDGRGYPNGLRGEEIPLSARIFAVADVLDAITSDRPYHRAASFEHAYETIRGLSGTQFDPYIVGVFLQLPPETWPAIAKEQQMSAGFRQDLQRVPAEYDS
ncbi:MAG TPA: HD domain-containing phosphohydrolase [Candidatus Acidoferrum sp.]|nr:HD domain-containing phosphohydrolase [Candidatus Acidoferrum sp.]